MLDKIKKAFSDLGKKIKPILIKAKDAIVQAAKDAWEWLKETAYIFLKHTIYGAYEGMIRGAHDGYLQFQIDMGYLVEEDAVWHTDIFIKEEEPEEEL